MRRSTRSRTSRRCAYPPRMVNIKPSRLGGLRNLLDAFDYCAAARDRQLRRRPVRAGRGSRADPVPGLAVPRRRPQRCRAERLQPPRPPAGPAEQPACSGAVAAGLSLGIHGRLSTLGRRASELCGQSAQLRPAARLRTQSRYGRARHRPIRLWKVHAGTHGDQQASSAAGGGARAAACCSALVLAARAARSRLDTAANVPTAARARGAGSTAAVGRAAPATARGRDSDRQGEAHTESEGPTDEGPLPRDRGQSDGADRGAQCVPASNCGTKPQQVSTHGTLLLQGKGLKSGEVVAFPHACAMRTSRATRRAPTCTHSKLGLVVTVPSSAHSGNIEVLLAGRRSLEPVRADPGREVHTAPAGSRSTRPRAGRRSVPPTASGTAFAGQGMWIWYMSASDGGSVASIAAQAHAAGVSTLFIKSSDGSTNYWSQFSPQLVAELHANGLKVCAWQYVYGSEPGRRGRTRSAGGGGRGRMPGDRRGVAVRRPLRGGADVHRNAAREDRRQLSAGAGVVPLRELPPRRSPTRSSWGRTARSSMCRRCTGRTSGPASRRCS